MSQSNKQVPTYSMSATLINGLKWHEYKNDDKSFNDLKQKITKNYLDNQFTARGTTFEDEVIAGQHSVMNPYLKDVDYQKWFSKEIDFNDFKIRLSGKVDAITKDHKHIYDIKRVTYHYKGKYDRDKTIQHDLYMYLCDDAEDFTYLIASDGDLPNSIQYHFETYYKDENTEQVIIQEVIKFLTFLDKHDLVEDYIKHYEFKPKSHHFK